MPGNGTLRPGATPTPMRSVPRTRDGPTDRGRIGAHSECSRPAVEYGYSDSFKTSSKRCVATGVLLDEG